MKQKPTQIILPRKTQQAATLFIAALSTASLQATLTVVNVDFGPDGQTVQTGLAAFTSDPGGATATWNGVDGTSPTAAGLLDSTGTATTVGLNFNSRGSFGALADQEVSAGAGAAGLLGDYLSSRADNNGFDLRGGNTISGLDPSLTYDLYLYGQGDNFEDTNNNGGQNAGFRLNGSTEVRHTSYDGTVGGDGVLVEDVEYVLFSGISPDATGAITFEYFNPGNGTTDPQFNDTSTGSVDLDGNNSRFSAVNGFQLVFTVPEPSSTLLLGLSGLGLLLRRRR